jgi:alpha-amylase
MFLSLVFHNHQPVGQLPWAFEDAWRDSYQPFLDVLEEHPTVEVALHFTGPLLDWLSEHKPQTLEQSRALVARGQVEVLGGGFYEPILAVWPHDDQVAQLEKLNARVEETFGQTPRGMWLAERVWEPQLGAPIKEAKLDYTFVDSTIFQNAGIEEAESFAVFKAAASNIEYSRGGNEDRNLCVFPINQPLRHIIPWHPGEESIRYLKSVHERAGDQAIVVFADDGEKFGGWPGTFDYVYTRGWLDTFFTLIEENAAWLQTIAPGRYLSTHSPQREVQLPAGSYSEMQDWSGGNWRHFLARYGESRDIYDEVLRVRDIVQKSPNDQAFDNILQAQSNDPLWHGVFGGLYLRHLRQALYARTIEAQVLTEGNRPFVRVKHEENGDIVLENEQLKIGVRRVGGHIFNWTSKASRHNVLSTLRRYREAYHNGNTPEDWHPRGALLDHFFGDGTTPDQLAQTRFPEQGDFVSEDWTVKIQSNQKAASIVLRRDGGVWVGGKQQPVSIEKTLTLRAGSSEFEIEYSICNNSDVALELWWGLEWNVALSGTDLPTRHYHAANHKKQLSFDEIAEFQSVSNPIAADSWLQLQAEWQFPQDLEMWHIPIWSMSQKEGGEIERTHQSSAFVFHQHLHLAPAIEYSISFKAALNSQRML